MDGFNEKKWFVYLNDHHEGPFSLADIQAKMSEGLVNRSSYVWADGMGDWKPMTEVEAFAPLTAGAPAPAAPHAPELPDAEPTLGGASAHTPDAGHPQAQPHPAPQPNITLSGHGKNEAESHSASAEPLGEATANGGSSKRAVKLAIFLLIPTGIFYAYASGYLDPLMKTSAMRSLADTMRPSTNKLLDKFPTLSGFFSPLPAMDEVDASDYEELKQAAIMPLGQTHKPRLAVAVGLAKTASPDVYVSSNLPDGANIDLIIDGVPESLLNEMTASGHIRVTLKQRWGKAGPLRRDDGKSLPQGNYRIYAFEADQQPADVVPVIAALPVSKDKTSDRAPQSRKLTAMGIAFLGGNNDATYKENLKKFHDKLKEKVISELTEVRQIAQTLESKLTDSVNKFGQLKPKKGKVTKPQQKQWGEFHTSWTKFYEDLDKSFKTWTPEALNSDRYYGVLFSKLLLYAQTVEKMHAMHHAYFTGSVDATQFDIQMGQLKSAASTALDDFNDKYKKIDEANKNSANGIPRKEGP